MSILLEFWELIVAGLAALVAVFYRYKAKTAEVQAREAKRSAQTHQKMRDYEREAMQLDDTSLADRLTRRR